MLLYIDVCICSALKFFMITLTVVDSRILTVLPQNDYMKIIIMHLINTMLKNG